MKLWIYNSFSSGRLPLLFGSCLLAIIVVCCTNTKRPTGDQLAAGINNHNPYAVVPRLARHVRKMYEKLEVKPHDVDY